MRGGVVLTWLLPALALAQSADGGVTVITGARARPPGTTSLRGGEARETPLTEHDALKAVQTFPGVGRPALGSADLVVWGAAPRETRVEVDGIEVPALFHLGGYRSVLSPGLVGRVELEPAPFRAETGRSLGGLVRVETAEPPGGLHGVVAVDLSDTSGWASLAGEAGSVTGAARVSTLEAVVGPFLRGAAADRYALPTSWDAQLRASLRSGAEDEVTLLALASRDRLDFEVASEDPSLARGRVQSLDVYRLGLTWRRSGQAERFTGTLYLGLDRRSSLIDTPLARASAREDAWVGGGAARWRAPVAEGVGVAVGVDGRFTRSLLGRSGPLTVPAREGDVVAFGEPLSDAVASDRWSVSALEAAAHAAVELALGGLDLSAAMRLSALATEVSRSSQWVAATPSVGLSALEFALEPRLTATWTATPWLVATAAAGLSHQAADAADRSSVFGTPALGAARGGHLAASLGVLPLPGLSVEATGFFRAASRLATRDRAAQPREAQLLVDRGEGRAWGLAVAVRQRPWQGLSGALGYTLGRSERRDAPDLAWRLADFDQTHVLTATARWERGPFQVGLRLRWATGLPRTPVVGSTFDTRRGVFEPLFGAQNAERLPDFVQLDLEAAWTFRWGQGWLQPLVEVLNVTNRQNVEEWARDSTFSRRQAILGLPLFATLGLRGGW